MSRLARHVPGLLCISALTLLFCACRKTDDDQRPSGGQTQAHAPLRGADSQAWLSDLGDLSGNSHCRTPLKLPLSRKPAWEFKFTPAEFGNQTVNQILHYDGKLAICARGPQIALIDARTGKLVSNEDVYKRMDPGQERERENFDTITFSEDGRLFALDDMGRYYSWAVSDNGLSRLWLGPPVKYGRAGLLAANGSFISGGDDVIYYASLQNGQRDWLYPAPQQNEGISCSASGKAVCWSTLNQISCLDMGSGASLWSCAVPSSVDRCTINDALDCVYVGREDETLECRSLNDGSLQWSYDWSYLLPPEQREERGHRISRANITVPLWALCADARGVVLQMASGDNIMLSPQGKVLWSRNLGTGAAAGLLFPNAFVVMQVYFQPDLRGRPSIFDPFNDKQPDWKIIKDTLELAATEKGQSEQVLSRARSELYIHLAVLDPKQGNDLDNFEPDVLPLCGLTPAGGNIVFGGTLTIEDQVKQKKGTTPVRRIRAYQWLEPEAK